MYKQIIIARKDLGMSAGKLAAQVSHASMAFLTKQIKLNAMPIIKYNKTQCFLIDIVDGKPTRVPLPEHFYVDEELNRLVKKGFEEGQSYIYLQRDYTNNCWIRHPDPGIRHYVTNFDIDKDLYEQWINGIFTKVVLQAKNRNQLMKAVEMAEELGWREDIDYFLIKDCCKTELEPEEVDENGIGRTLTCIGFAPKPAEEIDKIAKKFHIFEGEIV